MTDISEGSLNKAIENCRRFHPETEFDFRLGSGIDVLSEGETDDLIIAGMGGMLMTEILGKDPYKAKSFKKIVLQPRNNIGDSDIGCIITVFCKKRKTGAGGQVHLRSDNCSACRSGSYQIHGS